MEGSARVGIQTNDRTGGTVAARLWTSSLQRTELTAAYIPHPEVRSGLNNLFIVLERLVLGCIDAKFCN